MNEDLKKEIDNMSYYAMLERWRNAPAGHPWFQGDVGKYFAEVMKKKRAEIGDEAHVAASKEIGWRS